MEKIGIICLLVCLFFLMTAILTIYVCILKFKKITTYQNFNKIVSTVWPTEDNRHVDTYFVRLTFCTQRIFKWTFAKKTRNRFFCKVTLNFLFIKVNGSQNYTSVKTLININLTFSEALCTLNICYRPTPYMSVYVHRLYSFVYICQK